MASHSSEVKNLYERFEQGFERFVKPIVDSELGPYTDPVRSIHEGFYLRRFRSGIPIAVSDALSHPNAPYVLLGASQELMFSALLVEDDYLDNDSRRGVLEAAHIHYGEKPSLLAASIAVAIADRLVADADRKSRLSGELMRTHIKAKQDVYESFAIEVDGTSLDVEGVEQLHTLKTAQGFASIVGAGLIAQTSGLEPEVLGPFAEHTGIAGQITNDLHDLHKYAVLRGYSDIENSYPTMPLALARERWGDLDGVPQADLERILSEKWIIDRCVTIADEHLNRAREAIERAHPNVRPILELWIDANRYSPSS